MTHRRPSIHASDGAVIQSEVLLRHLWQCRRHLRLYGSVFFKATPWFWSTRYSSAIRAEGCPRACEPSRRRRSASTCCWVTAELPEAGRGRWEGRGPGLKLKETDAWRDGQKRGKYRNIRSINDAAGEPPGERPHQSPCRHTGYAKENMGGDSKAARGGTRSGEISSSLYASRPPHRASQRRLV